MLLRHERLEIILIGTALFISLFYLSLRAVIWDTFLWIAIAPMVAGVYLAGALHRFSRMRFNGLDWAFLLYLSYGAVVAVVAVFFLRTSQVLAAKTLIHYYSPVLFYFIARRYTYRSVGNVAIVTKLVWILAAVFIIDFFAEYYVVHVRESGMEIPWVKNELYRNPNLADTLWHDRNSQRVSTVVVSLKKAGLVSSAFFVLILPFFFYGERRRDRYRGWFSSWQFNTVLNAAALSALAFMAFEVGNKTAVLAAALALAIGLLSLRSVRKAWLMIALLSIGMLFAYGTLSDIVRSQFLTVHLFPGYDSEITPFEFIADPRFVVEQYSRAGPEAFVLGAFLSSSDLAAVSSPVSFDENSALVGLSFPLYFGFGWTLMLFAALAMTLRYSIRVARRPEFRFFGMAIVGLLIVYGSDLHYPTAISHGPLELMLVLVGALSSLHEIIRRSPDTITGDETDSLRNAPAETS